MIYYFVECRICIPIIIMCYLNYLQVDSGIQQATDQNLNASAVNNNTVAENILEKKETENKNEDRSERATTPDQSPSTKAKLRKVC